MHFSKLRMNNPNESLRPLIICGIRAACTAYRRTRWHRHLWKSDLTPIPSDGVIKAYKVSPGPETQASNELSPGLEALRARCEGPREGPDPSQSDPENTLITEGALTGHRHLQGFEKAEWKKWEGEGKKVRWCRLSREWQELPFTMTAMFQRAMAGNLFL